MAKSRPVRWREACAECATKLDELRSALSDLNDIRQEYEEWKDNLPDSLQTSPVAEKLEAVCDLELDEPSALQDLEDLISDAESVDLPQGFGRD